MIASARLLRAAVACAATMTAGCVPGCVSDPPPAIPARGAPEATALPLAVERTDVVLVGAGDIADCASNNDEQTATLVERLLAAASPMSRAFTAGDHAYPTGSPEQFRDCYLPSWGRFLSSTLSVAGNHDWMTPKAAGYFATFGPRAGTPQKPWRSVEVGGWHVVLLDSNCEDVGGCDTGSPQHRWLLADLAASTARCTVAVWHHPRLTSGPRGSDPRSAALWRALHDAGADVVLTAHEHLYERFGPADAAGAPDPAGMRSFVVGTGGKTAYPFAFLTAPGSEVRRTGNPAVFVLFLEKDRYRWAHVAVDGSTLDSGAADCR